eukprot:comp23246_c0_seq1/m.37961 comp23246_c0_seq1/g.37961  ORF comp23246_c0_seq1/g.37961 comp23246_c0_seq1/m.37961 type:complete len:631 (-) comp23246_c0_seq1:559-2451(-)
MATSSASPIGGSASCLRRIAAAAETSVPLGCASVNQKSEQNLLMARSSFRRPSIKARRLSSSLVKPNITQQAKEEPTLAIVSNSEENTDSSLKHAETLNRADSQLQPSRFLMSNQASHLALSSPQRVHRSTQIGRSLSTTQLSTSATMLSQVRQEGERLGAYGSVATLDELGGSVEGSQIRMQPAARRRSVTLGSQTAGSIRSTINLPRNNSLGSLRNLGESATNLDKGERVLERNVSQTSLRSNGSVASLAIGKHKSVDRVSVDGMLVSVRPIRSRYTQHPVVRVLLLGASGVGKTAAARRFVHGYFEESYTDSFFEPYTKTVKIDGQAYEITLIDSRGDSLYTDRMLQALAEADGCLVLYALDNEKSLEYAASALDLVGQTRGQIPRVLCGNKSDEIGRRGGSSRAALQLAHDFGIDHFEVTATQPAINIPIAELVRVWTTASVRQHYSQAQSQIAEQGDPNSAESNQSRTSDMSGISGTSGTSGGSGTSRGSSRSGGIRSLFMSSFQTPQPRGTDTTASRETTTKSRESSGTGSESEAEKEIERLGRWAAWRSSVRGGLHGRETVAGNIAANTGGVVRVPIAHAIDPKERAMGPTTSTENLRSHLNWQKKKVAYREKGGGSGGCVVM